MTADRIGSMACAFAVRFTARQSGIRRRSGNRLDGSLPGIRKRVPAPKGRRCSIFPGTAFRAEAGVGQGVIRRGRAGARPYRAAPAGVRYRADERDPAGAERRLIADRTISTAPSESRLSSGFFVVPGLPPDDLMGLGFDVTRVAALHENFECVPGRRPGHRVCFGQPAGRWQQRAERVSTIFDLPPQQLREPDVARGVVSLHGRDSHRVSLS